MAKGFRYLAEALDDTLLDVPDGVVRCVCFFLVCRNLGLSSRACVSLIFCPSPAPLPAASQSPPQTACTLCSPLTPNIPKNTPQTQKTKQELLARFIARGVVDDILPPSAPAKWTEGG
jgi:hypothetical protein